MKKKNLNLKKLKVQSFVTSMDEPADKTKEVKGGISNFYGGCGGTGGTGTCNTCRTDCNCTHTCYSRCWSGCHCGTQDFYACQ